MVLTCGTFKFNIASGYLLMLGKDRSRTNCWCVLIRLERALQRNRLNRERWRLLLFYCRLEVFLRGNVLITSFL